VADVASVVGLAAIHQPIVVLNGQSVRIVRDTLGRSFWECPRCQRSCRWLYYDEFLCHRCAGLSWSSRHVARQLPAVHRIARWRRQIGADPRPFAPIARHPRGRERYHRIIRQIRAAEAELVEHLAGINNDLSRRAVKLVCYPDVTRTTFDD
jgi:hypothetical protein